MTEYIVGKVRDIPSGMGIAVAAGRLTIAGPAAELLTDERVRKAYLG